MQLIAILIVAVPFAFGGLRLATTGDDARYLWVACASTAGAAVFLLRGVHKPFVTRARVVQAGIAATVGAAGVAVLQHARSVPAVAIVSLAFACCSVVGLTMLARARERRAEQQGGRSSASHDGGTA